MDNLEKNILTKYIERKNKQENKTLAEMAGEKYGIGIGGIPQASTASKYGFNSSALTSAKREAEAGDAVRNILAGKNIEGTQIGTRGGLKNVNSYNNPVQGVVEAVEHLNSKVGKGEDQLILALDTEWLGGGKAGKAIPIEAGFQVLKVTKDGKVEVGEKMVSEFFEIGKDDSERIKKILNKIKNSKGPRPRLNEDEYRTVLDLINMGNSKSLDPSKRNKPKVMKGENLKEYIDDAYEALENFTRKDSKALNRSNFANRVIEMMKGEGSQDFMIMSHNGYNADLKVLEDFLDTSSYNRLFGNKKHLDTQILYKSFVNEPVKEIYNNTKYVRGGFKLENIAGELFPEVDRTSHRAGSDARDTALIFQDLWTNKKGKLNNLANQKDEVWGVGTELFSTGVIMRDESQPLEAIAEKAGKSSYEFRDYQRTLTYKDAMYKVQEEFITKYDDDLYYGVVLHNMDDNLEHVVTAKSKTDLQHKIQTNFMNMDNVTQKYGKGAREKIRDYTLRNRAMREYRNMFTGYNAYNNFSRKMDLMNKVYQTRPDGKYAMYNGRFIKDVRQALIGQEVNGKVVTRSEYEKFEKLFPRLRSEKKALDSFHSIISGSGSIHKKSASLGLFKEYMDKAMGAHTENLELPEHRKQAKIFNDMGELFTVNFKDRQSLSMSIYSELNKESKVRKNFGFNDFKHKAKNMVYHLTDLNDPTDLSKTPFKADDIDKLKSLTKTGILTKDEAADIIARIDRVRPSEYGSDSGVTYIANILADGLMGDGDPKLERMKVIKGQEALSARKMGVLETSKLQEIYDYTSSRMDGTSRLKFNDEATERYIDKVDSYLKGEVDRFANGNKVKTVKEELDLIAKNLKANNLDMELELTQGDRVGLKMKIYADKLSQGVLDYKAEGVEIFIPLVNPETGLLEYNSKMINQFVPFVDKGGRAGIKTYQNKVFENFTFTDAKKIKEAFAGNSLEGTGDIQNRIQKRVTRILQGLAAGDRYRSEVTNDRVASSVLANEIKVGLDLNELIEAYTGHTSANMSKYSEYGVSPQEFLSMVLYDEDEISQARYKRMTGKRKEAFKAARTVKQKIDDLGLDINLSGVKGERAQKFFVSLKNNDPRSLSPLGYFTDPGREMLRQFTNMYELEGDDVVRIGKDGQLIRRSSLADKRGGSFVTDRYNQLTRGRENTVGLRTAFMTDYDIKKNMPSDVDPNTVSIIDRLTTHDDMMVVREDMIDQFSVTRDFEMKFDAHEELDGRIKKGEILRPGDNLTMGDDILKYEEKYDAVIKDVRWDPDLQKHVVTMDQVVETKHGTKVMDMYGNKYTTVVPVSAQEMDSMTRQLGESFQGIEAIAAPSAKKSPGSIIGSQVEAVMHELRRIDDPDMVTIGSEQKEAIKRSVKAQLEDMLGIETGSLKFKGSGKDLTAVIPGSPTEYNNIKGGIGGVLKKTDKIFEDLNKIDGFTTNKIRLGKDGSITSGILSYSVSAVDDWTGAVGADDEFVKVGLRQIEFLRHREGTLNADLSVIRKHFEDTITVNNGPFQREASDYLRILSDPISKDRIDSKELGLVRTTSKSTGDYFKTINFDDIDYLTRNENNKFYKSELDNTIVDDLFGGRKFYMELPEKVKLGDKGPEIDKIMMTATHFQDSPGDDIYLTEVQKAQNRVFNAVGDYRKHMVGDSTESMELFGKAQEELARSVNSYMKVLGRETLYSKGYVMENAASARQSHSGYFNYRGQSPADMQNPMIKNKLKEGDALISRADFDKMIGREVSDDLRQELMQRAEKEGISAISMREPVKEKSSMAPINLKVLSQADEDRLVKAGHGKNLFEGNAMMTLGTQIRQGADHDGDRFSIMLPQLAGVKAKDMQNMSMNDLMDKAIWKEMDKWQKEESKKTGEFTKYLLENDYDLEAQANEYYKSLHSTDDLLLRAGDNIEDKIIMIESRLQKRVGEFSNINTKYRRMAETVGSYSVDQVKNGSNEVYDMWNYIGTSIEQAPISAKHMTETVANQKLRGTNDLSDYIMASDNLLESMQEFNKEGIIENMKKMGMMEMDEEAGEWYFSGIKTENVRASLDIKGSPDERIYESSIIDMLNKMEEGVPGGDVRAALKSGTFNMGLGEPYSVENAMNRALDITSPTAASSGNFYAKDFLLDSVFSTENLNNMHASAAEKASVISQVNKGLGSETSKKTVSGFVEKNIHTAGDEFTSKVVKIGDVMPAGAGKVAGMGAVALGGAWLASSFIGSPEAKEVERGASDQAPSSDGTYIDPKIYAGAPQGAGPPTARVAPKNSGYEKTTVKIRANTMNGLTNEEIVGTVSQEIERQAGMALDVSIVSQDDRTKIDRDWLDQQFAKALESGYSY